MEQIWTVREDGGKLIEDGKTLRTLDSLKRPRILDSLKKTEDIEQLK